MAILAEAWSYILFTCGGLKVRVLYSNMEKEDTLVDVSRNEALTSVPINEARASC